MLLRLVPFFGVVEGLGPVRGGGDRDTSSGLGLCMRGRIVAEV